MCCQSIDDLLGAWRQDQWGYSSSRYFGFCMLWLLFVRVDVLTCGFEEMGGWFKAMGALR